MAQEKSDNHVKSLSSGLQGMRFMKRKRERDLRAKLADEEAAVEKTAAAASSSTKPTPRPERIPDAVRKSKKGGVHVIDESAYGEHTSEIGRRSFKKFNPYFEDGQNQKTSPHEESKESRYEKESELTAEQVESWREKYVTGTRKDERTAKKPRR
uniref:Uncharacterized protein n=1 Tax=Rhodosorus marinus TaxID=101924 RepID=A0A7S3EBN1_9RHOD|mmetsp:Transcript_23130/g.92480  ORF Transcript_23130/g.92480 Transcript_23130/m.92480 type:complete len:155 (+) Transcript_23130:177-641(+)